MWETSARAACVHPGGGWVLGWEEVRRSWEAIIEATSRIEFEVEEVVVRLEDPVAWVTCVEHVTGPDGQTAEIAATNGFVLGSRGWRMVLHHASPIVRPDAFGG